MMFKSKNMLIFILCLLFSNTIMAQQDQAIGQWKSYLPYNRIFGVCANNNLIYAAGEYGLFSYNLQNEAIETYSKANGMTDVAPRFVGFDPLNEVLVVTYLNSNIDLYKNHTFYNIPYLKLKSISGDKSIYGLYIDQGKAFISTGIGIIVLDLAKSEVEANYIFSKNSKTFSTYDFSASANYYYALTENGLYKSLKTNPNIQASGSWDSLLSGRNYQQLCIINHQIYLSTLDSLFVIEADTAQFLLSRKDYQIQNLDSCQNGLAIQLFNPNTGSGKLLFVNNKTLSSDSLAAGKPMNCISANDHHIWVADAYNGLNNGSKKVSPEGPFYGLTYDILNTGSGLYFAHGSRSEKWDINYNPNGVSKLKDDKWFWYNQYTFSPFHNLTDANKLAIDPKDSTLYIASLTDGLFYLKKDLSAGQIKDPILEPHIVDPSTYRVSGLSFDKNNNLWLTQNNSAHELVARSAKDGNWYYFSLDNTRPRPVNQNGAAGLIIDQNSLKWFFSPGGGGLLVYNDNNTLENPADDTYTRLVMGKGYGNLPDNNINCIVSDKNNTIWIGSYNGIGIINCPNSVIARQCEAEIRVVQYDNFAGELFSGENVKAIAVDGANRKWIGTNNGVWLLSEDASKIISRFTAENSPLPSNTINTISIDPKDGEVFFGTSNGTVSYRGTATEVNNNNKEILVFPNPVNHDYTGTIAIKGIVENADVRITDISGQLIYRCKALGGQAIWNGLDYTGRRPQSGVFLVFVSDNEGNEKCVTKFSFIH